MEINGRNKKVFAITLVLIIIIVSIGIYSHIQITNNIDGISALEAKNISDDIIRNQNVTLPFYLISATGSMSNAYPMGEIDDSGRSSIWVFTYCETSNVTHVVEIFEIFVFQNGSSRVVWENYSGAYFNVLPINNWNIDSTEAFKIAEENDGVKEFKSTYSGEFISVFSLYWDEDYHGEVWKLTWRYEGPYGNIEQLTVFIDAETGAVF